jgi:uncharacterized damage-inducible protein DinB
VAGVPEDKATTSPVGSGTSLLWLANHMADAELTWVIERFCRIPLDAGLAQPANTASEALERYRRVWTAVDELVQLADLDQECPNFDQGGPVNLRWILSHLLEETARHAGHADILRELIDGSTGR